KTKTIITISAQFAIWFSTEGLGFLGEASLLILGNVSLIKDSLTVGQVCGGSTPKPHKDSFDFYRIVSTKNTCLDDWGGKTGENSAALQPDNTPDSENRQWRFVPVDKPVGKFGNWYRIVSKKNTCLDNWGGKTGEDSAALQPDNDSNSNNRKWTLIPSVPVENWYRIVSRKNTCLDNWGGKTGEDSAALQLDNDPNSANRRWKLVPVIDNKNQQLFRIVSSKNTCLDNWGGKTGENSAALQLDNDPHSDNRKWKLIPVDKNQIWFKIVSTKNTCLDSGGGKTGENSAALQPVDTASFEDQIWRFIPVEDHSLFRIVSSKNTCLDNWGGKTGEDSAALQADSDPDSDNRKWKIIPVINKI
ncbi:MAG: RICIN domain-containing protein, partial [Bacteroidota bacterium]